MISTSVITLVHGRQKHLKNMILGLCESSQRPSELVIVHMNERGDYTLPETPFPIHRISITSLETKIPLAAARNRGAQEAQGDLLIFLDVDCIPETTLIENYRRAQSAFNGLIMGDIRYLPLGVRSENWSFDELRSASIPHPNRPTVNAVVEPTGRYELFWSLTFAITRQGFEKIGGFDTRYQGYGAEDTDFAFVARKQAVPFALSCALCYHQHHAVYRPPLQHFQDIITNARQFYAKWDRWVMESWLKEFADRGYITWNAKESNLEIIRAPTPGEIQAAYHEAPAGF